MVVDSASASAAGQEWRAPRRTTDAKAAGAPAPERTAIVVPGEKASTRQDYSQIKVPIIDKKGQVKLVSPEDLRKLSERDPAFQPPAEVIAFLKSARQANRPALEVQAGMQVLASCLQEKQHQRQTQEGQPPANSKLKLDATPNPDQEYLSNSPEKVTEMAEVLHKGYQHYHRQQEKLVTRVLREYKDDEGKVQIVDLLESQFKSLPEHWRNVNEISARNLLTIIQTLLKPEHYPTTPEQSQALALDTDFVLAVNTALYNVWARRSRISGEGKHNNPLFHLDDYRQLIAIAETGTPPKGDWKQFLGHYRTFLIQNRHTYANVLSHELRGATNKSQISTDTQDPTRVGETVADLQQFDANQNSILSEAEIRKIPNEVLIKIARQTAVKELRKDRVMTAHYLANTKM